MVTDLQSLHLLTLLIFIPAIGAIVMALFPPSERPLARGFGTAWSAAAFLLALLLWYGFDSGEPGLQFAEKAV